MRIVGASVKGAETVNLLISIMVNFVGFLKKPTPTKIRDHG